MNDATNPVGQATLPPGGTDKAQPDRNPIVRAVVTTDAAGRRRIAFAYRDGRRPIVRSRPGAPRASRIPATARGVAAHFGAPAPVPGAPPPPGPRPSPSGPPPPPEVCRALRVRAGLSQREAAEGAAVSRGMVSGLESPRGPEQRTVRPGRGRRLGERVGSVAADRYVAWLRSQPEVPA